MPERGAATPGLYLAFDFGLKRTGVAVGQVVTGSARAPTTLACNHGQPDWPAVQALLDEWRPAGLVVGIPRHMDGTEQPMTAAAERFARRLEGRFGLPVHRTEEQLSSYAAEQELTAAGRGGRRLQDRKQEIDRMAARIILESWFAEGGGA